MLMEVLLKLTVWGETDISTRSGRLRRAVVGKCVINRYRAN